MTVADFATLLGTLAVATGKELDDETVDVYHAALQDVPEDTLRAGVGRLMKSEKFFPSTGSIRRACDLENAGNWHRAQMPVALPPAALPDDDPRVWYACATCQDSGMASHWCTGSVNEQPKSTAWVSIGSCGSSACARFGAKGYGHEYVKRCACYATNPKVRERLEARRRFAEAEN